MYTYRLLIRTWNGIGRSIPADVSLERTVGKYWTTLFAVELNLPYIFECNYDLAEAEIVKFVKDASHCVLHIKNPEKSFALLAKKRIEADIVSDDLEKLSVIHITENEYREKVY